MKKVFFALFVLTITGSAIAGGTKIFRVSALGDFLLGEPNGVEISTEGYLSPGPKLEVYDLNVPSVWSALVHSNGKMFVGTGNSGKIYLKSGKEYKEVYNAQALAVSAIVEAPDGYIYISVVPGGKIYRLDPDGSGGKEWASVPEKYIWSLLVNIDGTLYAGTGPNGKIFTITKNGEVKEIFSSPGDHIIRLVREETGSMLASSARGVLYRVSKEKVTALISFPQREISAVAVRNDGEIIVGVNTAPLKAQPPTVVRPQEQKKKEGEGESPQERIPQGGEQQPQKQRGSMEIYRISRSGTLRLLLRVEGMMVTDIAVLEDKSVLVATTYKGMIIKITADNSSSLWTSTTESTVTFIATRKGVPLLVGVSSPGRIYEVVGAKSSDATYTSRVFDAGFISSWGWASWRADGDVLFETRSGNTEKPDYGFWSEWVPVGNKSGPIKSPSARFIQFRIKWNKSNAKVSDVKIAYKPSNQPPAIMGIDVITSSDSDSEGTPQGSPSAHQETNRTVLIKWKATNPDNDFLLFYLYYRKEGETLWVPITPAPITKTSYRWDVSDVPDGWYRVRLVVSDSASNPPAEALSDEILSIPFLVDNNSPVVKDLKIDRNNVVTGTAVDSFSRITRIDYCVDGGELVTVFPVDGIFDQLEERFEIELGEMGPGEHNLTVTVFDDGGNKGVAGMNFVAK